MKYTFYVLAAVGAAGCSPTTLFDDLPTQTLTTSSAEATVGSDGSVASTLVDTLSGSRVDGASNGFAYVAGYEVQSPVARGLAGVAITTDLGTPPQIGTASFSGTYEVAQLDALRIGSDDRPVGTSSTTPGDITLTVDFANRTLTGSDGDLTVNGTFVSRTLGGTVSYDGLDGTLVGQVGPTRAIGAFYGDDANTVFAGGFDASVGD